MNILILHRTKSASDYHRIFCPFRYLPLEDGENVRYRVEDDTYYKADFQWADLVIFNRHPTVELGAFIDMKREYGFKVWCDVDDSWDLYKEHYLYDNWKKAGISRMIVTSINNADIVTVTNKRLLRKVLTINKKCQIVPNALPIGHEQFRSDKTESSKLRFMYAGGPSHYNDLLTIEEFFRYANISETLKNTSQFIMAGYHSSYKEASLHSMNSIMRIAPGYMTIPALSLSTYMDHYNQTDVALAPLENNDFNTYKSNLKIIEAGCMKTPIIATKMYPFLEDIDAQGKGLYLCDTPMSWGEAARVLVKNPNMVADHGEMLYEYVKSKYDLLKVNIVRRQILNSFK